VVLASGRHGALRAACSGWLRCRAVARSTGEGSGSGSVSVRGSCLRLRL
jgi:hypothetical protein